MFDANDVYAVRDALENILKHVEGVYHDLDGDPDAVGIAGRLIQSVPFARAIETAQAVINGWGMQVSERED